LWKRVACSEQSEIGGGIRDAMQTSTKRKGHRQRAEEKHDKEKGRAAGAFRTKDRYGIDTLGIRGGGGGVWGGRKAKREGSRTVSPFKDVL